MSQSLREALEREHREIDEVLESFATTPQPSAEQIADLRSAVALLRRHIYFEEISLFPPLRTAGMFGPVMVMEHEHGQMWPVLAEVDALLAAGDTAPLAALCRRLLGDLADHNGKEEQILYVQAELLLTPAQLSVLEAGLADVELPDGWVCAGAARG